MSSRKRSFTEIFVFLVYLFMNLLLFNSSAFFELLSSENTGVLGISDAVPFRSQRNSVLSSELIRQCRDFGDDFVLVKHFPFSNVYGYISNAPIQSLSPILSVEEVGVSGVGGSFKGASVADGPFYFEHHYFEHIGSLDAGNPYSHYSGAVVLDLSNLIKSGDVSVAGEYYLSNGKSSSRTLERLQRAMPEMGFEVGAVDRYSSTIRTPEWQVLLIYGLLLATIMLSLVGISDLWIDSQKTEIGVRRLSGASPSQIVAIVTGRHLLASVQALAVAFPSQLILLWITDLRWDVFLKKLLLVFWVMLAFSLLSSLLHARSVYRVAVSKVLR